MFKIGSWESTTFGAKTQICSMYVSARFLVEPGAMLDLNGMDSMG